MATRISPTPYTLVGNGAASAWLDLQSITEAFEFNISITGTVTCALETANDADNKTDAVIAQSFTASVAKVAQKPFPRLIRFRNTSGTGTAVVTLGKSIDTRGNLIDVPAQGTSNSPSNLFA